MNRHASAPRTASAQERRPTNASPVGHEVGLSDTGDGGAASAGAALAAPLPARRHWWLRLLPEVEQSDAERLIIRYRDEYGLTSEPITSPHQTAHASGKSPR
jgi:hypothetical protein